MMRLLLGVVALAAGLACVRGLIHDPPLRTDPARIDALYREVLGEEQPRPTGSDADRRVVERIFARLTKLGYQPEVQRGFGCAPNGICAFSENVIARYAGTSTGVVLLAAHHDTVPASPGGYDDGGGVVAQLEIARVLMEGPPLPRSIILLFTDAEELALNGARLFAEEHRWGRDIDAMIALEAMSGPTTMFRGARQLAIQRWMRAQGLSSPLYTSALQYFDSEPGFDTLVFDPRGIPTLVFTGHGDAPRYHSPLDRGDTADKAAVAGRTDFGLAFARTLAVALPERDTGLAGSFLAPGVGVVAWPERWTPVAGPLVLLMVAALAVGRAKRRPIQLVIEASLTVVLAGATAVGGVALLLGLRKVEWLVGMWISAPMVLQAGLIALFAAELLVVRRQVDPWAALLGLAGVGAVLSVLAPAGAHAALLPALIGALGASLSLGERGATLLGLAAALFACGLLFGQMDALSWVMNMGYEYVLRSAKAVTYAVLLVALVPNDHGRRRWAGLLVALGVAGVLGAGIAARVGDGAVERVSVRLHTDLDRGTTRWLVMDVLPPALAAQATFERQEAPFEWWPQASVFVASATVALPTTEGPELTGTSSRAGALRRFHGWLRSPRGAWMISVAIPPGAPVEAVHVHGRAAEILPSIVARARGHRVYNVVGARTASVAFDVDLRGDEPVEVELIELDPGLPAEARGLGQRRGPNQVPAHVGDARMITRRVRL